MLFNDVGHELGAAAFFRLTSFHPISKLAFEVLNRIVFAVAMIVVVLLVHMMLLFTDLVVEKEKKTFSFFK